MKILEFLLTAAVAIFIVWFINGIFEQQGRENHDKVPQPCNWDKWCGDQCLNRFYATDYNLTHTREGLICDCNITNSNLLYTNDTPVHWTTITLPESQETDWYDFCTIRGLT